MIEGFHVGLKFYLWVTHFKKIPYVIHTVEMDHEQRGEMNKRFTLHRLLAADCER